MELKTGKGVFLILNICRNMGEPRSDLLHLPNPISLYLMLPAHKH